MPYTHNRQYTLTRPNLSKHHPLSVNSRRRSRITAAAATSAAEAALIVVMLNAPLCLRLVKSSAGLERDQELVTFSRTCEGAARIATDKISGVAQTVDHKVMLGLVAKANEVRRIRQKLREVHRLAVTLRAGAREPPHRLRPILLNADAELVSPSECRLAFN